MTALDNCARAVREAGQGARRKTLNDRTLWLASRPDGPDRREAERELVRAALEAGMDEREARATIAFAWRDGERRRGPTLPSRERRRGPSGTPLDGHRELLEALEVERPPLAEVRALADESRRAVEDDSVMRWLELRGFDGREGRALAEDVSRRGLVRALPIGPMPAWARKWTRAHRALVPMFDADGDLASWRARAVVPGVEVKSLAPAGYSTRGLVMACERGRGLLRGEPWDLEATRANGVTIAEGEPDWLSLVMARLITDRSAPAVFGVVAGSWTAELAARVPSGTRVRVMTHADGTGESYAAKIAPTLVGRCVVMVSGGVKCKAT